MYIGFNSPEAFEEIIWLFYMRNSIVSGSHIRTLSVGKQCSEFEKGFKENIKKLLAVNETEKRLRYLSKNNANISRIELINKIFPSSSIIVPFRNPLSQVGSLMIQHQKFIEIHKQDAFAKKYMKWLGHFDFGGNFKPINCNFSINYGSIVKSLDKTMGP